MFAAFDDFDLVVDGDRCRVAAGRTVLTVGLLDPELQAVVAEVELELSHEARGVRVEFDDHFSAAVDLARMDDSAIVDGIGVTDSPSISTSWIGSAVRLGGGSGTEMPRSSMNTVERKAETGSCVAQPTPAQIATTARVFLSWLRRWRFIVVIGVVHSLANNVPDARAPAITGFEPSLAPIAKEVGSR